MDMVNIFQTLTFPVAVCAVLFSIILYFTKHALAMIKDYLKEAQEQNKATENAYIAIIKEETSVISSNTNAFNSLSVLMGKLISIIGEKDK